MRYRLLILGAAVALFTLAWMNTAPLTAFTSDVGLRLIQAQALIDQEWRSFAIPYPQHHLDPDRAHIPYYYAYSIIDDDLYFNISPFFPLLGSLLYAGFGTFGLVILPVASGLVAAWLTVRLARLSGISHAGWVFFSTLFATPLFLYSVLFWDHTFATALATAGIYAAARGLAEEKRYWFVVGGCFVGLTLGQRPEAYTFAIALGLSLLLLGPVGWRALSAVVGGAIAGVLPLWLLQYRWVGHPLGLATAPHLLGYGRPEQYPLAGPGGAGPLHRKLLLLSYIQPDDSLSIAAVMLVLLGTILLILSLKVERLRHPALLSAGTFLTVAAYLLTIWLTVTKGDLLPGIVTTFPLVGLSLVYANRGIAPDRRSHLIYRMVMGTALLFVVLMVAIWPAHGGRQWGARYLLLAYPLLVYLAFYAYATYRPRLVAGMPQTLKLSLAALLLVSLFLHGAGLREQTRLQREVATLKQDLAGIDSDTVITNNPWLPAQMGPALDKTFFYASDGETLTLLLERLVEDEVRSVAIIPVEFRPLDVPAYVHHYQLVNVAPYEFELQDES